MVNIKVKNGYVFEAGGNSFQCGDGDVVQVTKAHGFFARGVMAWRTHETKNGFTFARQFQRTQRGTDGHTSELGNLVEERRIAVEIFRRIEARYHFQRVGAENRFIVRFRRRAPVQRQFGLGFEQFNRGRDAQRPFGMSDVRITGAVFVGNDGHGKNLTTNGCEGTRISFVSGKILISAEKKFFELSLADNGADGVGNVDELEVDVATFEIFFEPHHKADAGAVHEGHS